MPAYIIVDAEVTDPERYAEYRKAVPPTLAEHGGRMLVRGGEWELIEGDWKPKRVIVVEFPSVEKAKSWYASPAYAAARELRRGAANLNMIVVEGV